MKSKYAQARDILDAALKEAYLTLKDGNEGDRLDEDEDEDGVYEIDEGKAFVGKWVIFFETTAPSRHIVDGEAHHTFAKGFFCVSGDGADTSLTEWEIRGMMDYARAEGVFG